MDLHDYPYIAENYDLYLNALQGGKDDGMVAFYLELARAYGQAGVLDLGCGTGAALIPLLQAGFRVIGLDKSQAMLDVMAARLAVLPQDDQLRASIICAGMADLDIDACCSLAIIPRSGFMHLLTSNEQERALKAIYRALAPGGVLAFNTFDPNYELIARNLKGKGADLQFRAQYTNRRGLREWIWNRTEYDPRTQQIEALWIFEEMDADGAIVETRQFPLSMRWTFESELGYLLRLCGFEVLETYSNYKKAPRKYGGNIIWIVKRS